jgi:ribosomal protein S21
LKFAKTISDPKVAAGLVEKAADLKSKGDERPDPSPRAPDIECSTWCSKHLVRGGKRDELPLQGVVEEALSDGGFASDILSSGEEALALFKGGAKNYRALLTDVNLKGRIDGWEVARQVSASPAFTRIPIRSIERGCRVQVLVRDNNVDQALKVLKKKMQREGIFREMSSAVIMKSLPRRRPVKRPKACAAHASSPARSCSAKACCRWSRSGCLAPVQAPTAAVPVAAAVAVRVLVRAGRAELFSLSFRSMTRAERPVLLTLHRREWTLAA